MDDALFNETMAMLDRQIDSLPEDRRPALRELAAETRRRATEIREAAEAGRAGAAELVGALARLTEAHLDLMDKASSLNLLVKYARFDREASERESRGEGRDHGD